MAVPVRRTVDETREHPRPHAAAARLAGELQDQVRYFGTVAREHAVNRQGRLEVPLTSLQAGMLVYGYALTCHKAQGITVDVTCRGRAPTTCTPRTRRRSPTSTRNSTIDR
jgi:hypothetical protein